VNRRAQAGFSIVEVLIASVVFAIALGAIFTATLRLGETNARAEAQALAASAAEAAAQRWATNLPPAGSSVQGVVGDDLQISGLTAQQTEITSRLQYTLTQEASGRVQITVQRNDLPSDPYALTLQINP